MLSCKYANLRSTVQTGYVGEAYAKIAFFLAGFEVYTTDCDDQGIDFVARKAIRSDDSRDCGQDRKLFMVQVKAVGTNVNPFIYEKKFKECDEYLFVAVRLDPEEEQPAIYVARRCDWQDDSDSCLRRSAGGNAGEYYEISFSKRYAASREKYRFETYLTNELGFSMWPEDGSR